MIFNPERLNRTDTQLVDLAMATAYRSSLIKFRTGAIIFNKRRVAIGWSHRSHVNRSKYPRSMHAEPHAIARCHFEANEIIVLTLTSYNYWTNARPCINCAIWLEKAGIEIVHHSVSTARPSRIPVFKTVRIEELL